ncbi:hypothetical protein ACH427_17860 [Streptomyces sp. NPDC020379]|uniref:hypothetical protein n=1 Tax=Streptomyces sp. NPDC020379 TaxID=3365071 RepID=UPI0037896C8F
MTSVRSRCGALRAAAAWAEALFHLSFPFIIKMVKGLPTRGLWVTVVAGNLFVGVLPAFAATVGQATG